MTTGARERFLALFEKMEPRLEQWIIQTGEGREEDALSDEGKVIKVRTGGDPYKAADLILRMAEYHVPKLARLEHTGPDGSSVVVQVLTLKEKRNADEA